MADNKKDREWSTRTGVIKEGSIDTEYKTAGGKEGHRAVIVNAEGAEHFVVAFNDNQKKRLAEAAASEKPMVLRGPAFFEAGNVANVMVNTVAELGAPREKKELTEEEKAGKAARAKEAAIERDKTRLPVIEGTVEENGTVSVDGTDVKVTGLGQAWELTEEKLAALQERFPDVDGLKVGDKVQFASFEAPEPEDAPAGP